MPKYLLKIFIFQSIKRGFREIRHGQYVRLVSTKVLTALLTSLARLTIEEIRKGDFHHYAKLRFFFVEYFLSEVF